MSRLPKLPPIGLLVIAVCASSCGPISQKQEVVFEGRNISELTLIYKGKKTVDEARLRGVMSTKKGTPYATTRLDDDIKALYSSGYVDDVRFLAKPNGEEVKVTAEIRSREPIGPGPGYIVGNTVFKDSRLAKETRIKKDTVFNEANVAEACRRIERFYRREDYPEVKVAIRTFPGKEPWTERFIFVVDEGPKVERSLLHRLGLGGKSNSQ